MTAGTDLLQQGCYAHNKETDMQDLLNKKKNMEALRAKASALQEVDRSRMKDEDAVLADLDAAVAYNRFMEAEADYRRAIDDAARAAIIDEGSN